MMLVAMMAFMSMMMMLMPMMMLMVVLMAMLVVKAHASSMGIATFRGLVASAVVMMVVRMILMFHGFLFLWCKSTMAFLQLGCKLHQKIIKC